MLLASILCCWRPYCAVGVNIVLLVYILCCWRPYCAVGVHIVLLVSILCCWCPCCASTVLLLASLYYFWHAVAVPGFPAVEGVIAVACVHANPGVHILAGGFTYLILE